MDPDLIKYSLLKNKKDAQNIWSWDLMHEEPFGYRVAHHGYLLMSFNNPVWFQFDENLD